jgi:hypothetical protein
MRIARGEEPAGYGMEEEGKAAGRRWTRSASLNELAFQRFYNLTGPSERIRSALRRQDA